MTNKVYQLETLTCPSCALKIEGAVKKLAGVSKVQTLFNASKVKVDYDENLIGEDSIRKAIESLGFDVLDKK